jgi:hypothetical protein
MKMRGVYRFYQDGKMVAESDNLITTEGARLILRVLAEQASSLGQAIGLGVGNAAAVVGDTRLKWEIDRAAIDIKNVDYDNSRVIMKTTLPQNSIYTIYEVGLWSQFTNSFNSDNVSRVLTTFETAFESWTNTTLDSTQARTSPDSVKIDAGASATTTSTLNVDLDLSGYSALDTFNIAFYKANNNITTLKLNFASTTGSWEGSATVSALPIGYNIISISKGSFVATGTPDWSAITSMNVKVTAGASAGYLIMDGIRIEDGDTLNPSYALVSRSVLATPLVKTDSSPMDIEYALEFNVS